MPRPIPSRLLSPPTGQVPPLVQTRSQELPFDQLSWLNFEKLCLKLAQKESAIEDYEEVRPYGVQGDDQGGIDLFARLRFSTPSDTKPRYCTYQCKNEKEFGPAKIKAAVRLFRKGKWRTRSNEFVLCTRESLAIGQRTDEVELQRRVLARAGIAFTTWDSVALNRKLKTEPEVVDDFFGREWVRLFCGPEAADALGQRRPLTRERVVELRASLRDFYARVFRLHDPSLPGMSRQDSATLPLIERFVVPDIDEALSLPGPAKKPQNTSESSSQNAHQRSIEDRGKLWGGDTSETLAFSPLQLSPQASVLETTARRPLETWLLGSRWSVVLGDPGSGKSSLSRFLTLDLLADEPKFLELNSAWGHLLPVWIPFGLWTKRLARSHDGGISISQIIEDWFHSQEEDRLWELVREALDDDRLVLLVDGLDEWSDEKAARLALKQLQIFVERRHIPVIVTSRPYGFARLAMSTQGWQVSQLAPFSRSQQEQLARTWFTYFLLQGDDVRAVEKRSDNESEALKAQATSMASTFMAEILRSPDLRELAQTPLLLCLFIGFRLGRKPLPLHRFRAYDDAVRYLIEDHPHRRSDPTAVSPHSGTQDLYGRLSESEIRSIYAFLAFRLHSDQGHGTVDTDDARRWVEEFVKHEDRFGLEHPQAREISRSLLEIGDDATGLLVRKSFRDLGFYHRVFQEFLAAVHLASLPEADMLGLVEEKCQDPQWHEVILALCSRQEQPDRFKRLVATLEKAESQSTVSRYRVLPLLAEIAFGPFECPAGLANRIAARVFERIESDPHPPHTARLLCHALEGLRSARLKERVVEKLLEYFPRRRGVWSGIYRAMGEWERAPNVEAVLFRALFDEEGDCRLASAGALARLCGGNTEIGERLALLAHTDLRAEVRAAALNCLRLGWPQHPQLADLADMARTSPDLRLRYEGVVSRIMLGLQDKSDRRALWDIVTSRHLYRWCDEDGRGISDVLLLGWPGSSELKRECFLLARRLRKRKSLRKGDAVSAYDAGDFTARIVAETLIKGFADDEDVVQLFVEQFTLDWETHRDEDHTPKCLIDDFHGAQLALLKTHLGKHPLIKDAARQWLWRDWRFGPWGWIHAALIVGGEKEKARLIEAAKSRPSTIWPNTAAQALLEGWGMDDSGVEAVLNELAFGSADKASALGAMLPQVIPDPVRCRERLVEILRDPRCVNFSEVLVGLEKLGDTRGDKEVVDALFASTGPLARYGVSFDTSSDEAEWEAGETERQTAIQTVISLETGEVDIKTTNWGAFFDNYRTRDILGQMFILYCDDPRVRDLAVFLLDLPTGEFAAIGRGFRGDTFIQNRLLKMASPLPASLRRLIVRRLREGLGDEELEWKLARLATFDRDSQVHVAGSLLFHQRIKAVWDGQAAPPSDCVLPAEATLIERLRRGLHARGAWAFSRYEGDFVALLALGRLDVVHQEEPQGLHFQFLSQNPILVEVLVEHWGQITEQLGNNPFRENKNDRDEEEFWETATPLSAAFPDARAAALNYWQAHLIQLPWRGEGFLRLLAYLGDRELLLDACQRMMEKSEAAVLLGQFFGGDETILHRILGDTWQEIKRQHAELKRNGLLPTRRDALSEEVANKEEVRAFDWQVIRETRGGILEVLCEGWPNSEEAQILFEMAQRRGWWHTWGDWFLIAERISPPERMATKFFDYLAKAPTWETYERNSEAIWRVLRRRLRHDEGLAEKLWERLNGSPTGYEKATLSRLLMNSPTHSENAKNWICAEVEQQQETAKIQVRPIEMGFDLAIDQERPVVSVLLDLVV